MFFVTKTTLERSFLLLYRTPFIGPSCIAMVKHDYTLYVCTFFLLQFVCLYNFSEAIRIIQRPTVRYSPQFMHNSIGLSKEVASWETFLNKESGCVESNYIMLEIYFGVHTSSQRLIQRRRRSCPLLSIPVGYDPFTRQQLSRSTFPIEHIFSHPQYRMEVFHRSPSLVAKFFRDVRNTFISVLETAEKDAFKHIIEGGTTPSPVTTNTAIPVLCGDYSRTTDTDPMTQFLFYAALRKTINSFVGTTSLRFFTTPKFCRHISGVQKAVGDMTDAYPKYLLPYRFDTQGTEPGPATDNLSRSFYTGIILGADTVSIVTRVINPQSVHHKLIKLSEVPKVGIDNVSEMWRVAPFMNIGINRALTLLLRLYCQRAVFRKSKVCMFPCFRSGWVQPCTGGTPRRPVSGDRERVGLLSSDTFRLAWYCDRNRNEMHLHQQRELCSDVLKYNISEPCIFSRSRIHDCNLVVGTGNGTACREAIRSLLLSNELPFFKETVGLGYSSVRGLGHHRNTVPSEVVILGPLAPVLARSLSLGTSIVSGDSVLAANITHSSRLHKTRMSMIKDAAQRACEDPDLLTIRRKRHLGRVHSCLQLSYIVELLYAVGARETTLITFETGRRTFAGFLCLGNENNPVILRDTIHGRHYHWKGQQKA